MKRIYCVVAALWYLPLGIDSMRNLLRLIIILNRPSYIKMKMQPNMANKVLNKWDWLKDMHKKWIQVCLVFHMKNWSAASFFAVELLCYCGYSHFDTTSGNWFNKIKIATLIKNMQIQSLRRAIYSNQTTSMAQISIQWHTELISGSHFKLRSFLTPMVRM